MFFVMIRIQFEHVEHFAVHATHAGPLGQIDFLCLSPCGRNYLNKFLVSPSLAGWTYCLGGICAVLLVNR